MLDARYEESTFHAIWECKGSKKYWRDTPFFPRPGPTSVGSPTDLLWWCWKGMTGEVFEDFVAMCWWVWSRRNKELFGEAALGEEGEYGWRWVADYLTHFRAFHRRKDGTKVRG